MQMLFFFSLENEPAIFEDAHLSHYMFCVCLFALYFGEIFPEAFSPLLPFP